MRPTLKDVRGSSRRQAGGQGRTRRLPSCLRVFLGGRSWGLALALGLSAARAAGERPAPPCQELSRAIDLGNSPLDDRRVFCTYAKDLVVGACCQDTLHACLLAHPDCARARVLAAVGLATIASGATEEAALAAAARYTGGLAYAARRPIDLHAAPCRGKGPVTLVEFSDFDCPHCAGAAPLVLALEERFPKLRLCVLAFPLHPHSELAAAAALFADRSGRYWAMSQALYESQDGRVGLSEKAYIDSLVATGKEVGLSPAALRASLAGGGPLALVQRQSAQAQALKIPGTPAFFLDGHPIESLPLSQLAAAVADEKAYLKAHPK